MHGIRDNKVLLQAGFDAIVILLPGVLRAIFYDGIMKERP